MTAGASRGICAALLAHYRGAGRKALGTCRPANARPPLFPLDVADPARRAARFETLDLASSGLFEDHAARPLVP